MVQLGTSACTMVVVGGPKGTQSVVISISLQYTSLLELQISLGSVSQKHSCYPW